MQAPFGYTGKAGSLAGECKTYYPEFREEAPDGSRDVAGICQTRADTDADGRLVPGPASPAGGRDDSARSGRDQPGHGPSPRTVAARATLPVRGRGLRGARRRGR